MGAADASDDELLDAYRQAPADQRRDAANRLFERHYTRVARWCLRFTGDRDRAADLAQAVFLKAFRHLDAFEGGSQFSTWLYVIARHEFFATVRKDGGRPAPADGDALIDVPSPAPGPDRLVEAQSSAQLAYRVLAEALDDTERAVFTLHFGDELSLDAITRLLGLTNASGAKAYIVSAKRKLAKVVRRFEARGGRV